MGESWSLLLLLVVSPEGEEVVVVVPKMGLIEALFEEPPLADRFFGFSDWLLRSTEDADDEEVEVVEVAAVEYFELLLLLFGRKCWCWCWW